MARLPWKRIKIFGLFAILIVAALSLTVSIKTILGQTTIILLFESAEELDSLLVALHSDESYAALRDKLAFSSIWHIGSMTYGTGFKHVFYYAGKKRSMARVEGVSITTFLDDFGNYKVSTIEEVFAHQDLGSIPGIRDAQGLEILKAALEDEGVRAELGISIRENHLQFQGLRIQTIKPNSQFTLTLSAPLPNQEIVEMKWQVLKNNENLQYVFLSD